MRRLHALLLGVFFVGCQNGIEHDVPRDSRPVDAPKPLVQVRPEKAVKINKQTLIALQQILDYPDELNPSDDDIQSFDWNEHKLVADSVIPNKRFAWRYNARFRAMAPVLVDAPGDECVSGSAIELELTFGDLVMLSGDYFDALPTASAADNLFSIAAKPSKHPGTELATQDEIIYAIYHANPRDPRFTATCATGHPRWSALANAFSQGSSTAVRKRVGDRYLQLASKNDSHFLRPNENEAANRTSANSSALMAYRALHGQAIKLALDGRDRGEAYAMEAAADHYLSDSFAAGHVRTRRTSLRQFWDCRYPRFWNAFRDLLIDDLTDLVGQQSWWFRRARSYVKSAVSEQVTRLFETAPELKFGDAIAKIVHDVDNERGLWVTNDQGEHWLTYGDGYMFAELKDNSTFKATRQVLQHSLEEIDAALASGKPPATEVYIAETYLPRPDPARASDNGTLDARASAVQDVWTIPIRQDASGSSTLGSRLEPLLKKEVGPKKEMGAFYKQLWERRGDVDESKKVYLFTAYPRAAYDAFLARLDADPHGLIRRILADAACRPGKPCPELAKNCAKP